LATKLPFFYSTFIQRGPKASSPAKGYTMSDQVADLLLRNLLEVFNERDAARRIGAVKSIYAKEAEFFEGDERIKGHDAINAKVSELQASFPPGFAFSPTSSPARNHDLGRLTWRLGPAGTPAVATGMDVAVFKNDRIQSLYVFLEEPADKSSRPESTKGFRNEQ
jgi:hypothetical protein